MHPLHAGRLSVIHTLSLSVPLNLHSPSHLPLTLSPASLPPCYWTSTPNQSSNHSPSDLFFFVFPSLSLSIFPLTRFFSVCPLLRRQWRRQTGREDIRWCTTRLERKMAERQRRRGRYMDWYEGKVNYWGLPIRGQSDGSVCLAAASQKHHQLPPCLSSAATRPQLPSAISGGSLDAEGDTVGEHASSVCRHGWYVLSGKHLAFNYAICIDSRQCIAASTCCICLCR